MIPVFLFWFFLISSAWIYGGYFLFMVLLSAVWGKKNKVDSGYTPQASIIIPTFNEERVIEERLKNIFSQDYPRNRLQVLVVDSGSTDKTVELVQRFKAEGVEVLTEKLRNGKGAAIRYALNFCRNEIIVVSDANSYFAEPSCLRSLLAHFSDPKVGGATGRYFSREKIKAATTAGTFFFREYENILRSQESAVDSAVSLFGELFACRKTLCFIDDQSLAEDLETSIYIRKRGFCLAYEPRSSVYEYAPYLRREFINQRRSIIIGTIQALRKHKSVLFNPRYGLYGAVILPGHKLFPVLSPFFILGGIIVDGIFFSSFLSFCSFLFAGLFLLLALLNLLNKKIPNPLKIVLYVILVNFSCLLAWKDYFLGRYSVKWKKMESSRV